MHSVDSADHFADLDSAGAALSPPFRYAVAVTALASANAPNLVSALALRCNALLSRDDMLRFVEQSRESLLKMISTIGAPRVLNATGALMGAVDDETKKRLPATSHRTKEEYDYDAIRGRGLALWNGVYSRQAEKLANRIDAWYPDLIEVIQTDLYGRLLSDGRVLDAKSTELCAIGALHPIDVPAQLKSHVLGAERLGASASEVDAAMAVAQCVCAMVEAAKKESA